MFSFFVALGDLESHLPSVCCNPSMESSSAAAMTSYLRFVAVICLFVLFRFGSFNMCFCMICVHTLLTLGLGSRRA